LPQYTFCPKTQNDCLGEFFVWNSNVCSDGEDWRVSEPIRVTSGSLTGKMKGLPRSSHVESDDGSLLPRWSDAVG